MNPSQDTAAPVDPPTPKPPSIFELMLARASAKLADAQAAYHEDLALLGRMSPLFDKLPESLVAKCVIYGAQLDLENLTREEAVAVMSALNAGTWKKSANICYSETIDYEGEVDGIKVRLWAAAPPDSCRVIEFDEIVPAATIKRRKLVCSDKEAT